MRELRWHQVDYASVDVEGAEDHVLKTLDLSTTKVVLVEAEDCAGEKNLRVRRLLQAAGMVRFPLHEKRYKGGGGFNELWAQKDIVDYRPWYNQTLLPGGLKAYLPKTQMAIEGLFGGLAQRCKPGHCEQMG